MLAYVGCIAGAAPRAVYFGQLQAAGLGEIEVLNDVDSLSRWAEAAPEEARALAERTGVKPEDVAGQGPVGDLPSAQAELSRVFA